MEVSHGAHYVTGQEYVIFSYVDAAQHERTFGGPLGRFRIMADRSGSKAIRIYSGHPLSQLLGTGAGLRRLDAFSSDLREAAARDLR